MNGAVLVILILSIISVGLFFWTRYGKTKGKKPAYPLSWYLFLILVVLLFILSVYVSYQEAFLPR